MKIINLSSVKKEKTAHGMENIFKRVFVRKGDIGDLFQIAVADFSGPVKTEGHFHESAYEIFFVLEGEGKFIVDGKNFRVKKDDFIAIYPKEKHVVEVAKNKKLKMYYLLLGS